MGRARRAKKKDNNIGILLTLVSIFLIAVTFFMLFDIKNKLKKTSSSENIISDEIENTVNNEVIGNDVTEQEINNEVNLEENTVANEIEVSNNTVTNQTSNTNKQTNTSSAPAIPAVTDDKQKAIELVKKEWGSDETVSFSFDYINENGEYIVAVKDKSSATVKYYFRVNLQTESVELD